MDLTTKQKGNITELEVILAFSKLGIPVMMPYGDCYRYDCVVDINNKFYRIQVKTSTYNEEDGFATFRARNTTTQNGKVVHHAYTKEEIDFFATIINDNCYLIPVEETSGSEKRLRFKPPKNNQRIGITFAEDYELERMVNKL